MNSNPEKLDEQSIEKLRLQSEVLFQDFKDHLKECQTKMPEMTDKNWIFNCWAVQKIANLEVLVLRLVERVCELEKGRRGIRRKLE
jgi:hypothetical protein